MVFETWNLSLQDFILSNEYSPEILECAVKNMYKLIERMSTLIEIKHCDLAPRNVLLDSNTGQVKLIDFQNIKWGDQNNIMKFSKNFPLYLKPIIERHHQLHCRD